MSLWELAYDIEPVDRLHNNPINIARDFSKIWRAFRKFHKMVRAVVGTSANAWLRVTNRYIT